MTEYEKWLKGKAGIGWYTGTAEGWRAALEWVKRELPRAEAGFINPDLGLGEILNKELENLNKSDG